MELKDIFKELEDRLNEIKPKLAELDEEITIHNEAVRLATEALNIAEAKRAKLRNNVDALEMAIESLKSGEFDLAVETVAGEPKKVENTTDIKKKKRQLIWQHKDARVAQYDRHGNKMADWRSQNAAARTLGWSQSSVSHFMKFNKDEQIRKKNFYLAYEY